MHQLEKESPGNQLDDSAEVIEVLDVEAHRPAEKVAYQARLTIGTLSSGVQLLHCNWAGFERGERLALTQRFDPTQAAEVRVTHAGCGGAWDVAGTSVIGFGSIIWSRTTLERAMTGSDLILSGQAAVLETLLRRHGLAQFIPAIGKVPRDVPPGWIVEPLGTAVHIEKPDPSLHRRLHQCPYISSKEGEPWQTRQPEPRHGV